MPRQKRPSDYQRNGRASQAQLVDALLHKIVRTYYPAGHFPIREGGRWFKLIADELELPEGLPADRAFLMGFWPWTPEQVDGAHGELAEARNCVRTPGNSGWI